MGRERGQAAVETALILPMFVFLILGTIQLGMMHQARLMTEYAAYRAARVGIVNHGDCEMMKNSAVVALLPTFGPRTDTIDKLGVAYAKVKIPGGLLHPMGFSPGDLAGKGLGQLDVLRIEVVNPKKSQLDGLFQSFGGHLDRKELDWDDMRSGAIAGNLLSVRVRYNYQLRIPFANYLLHSWSMGAAYLKDLRGVSFANQEAAMGMVSSFDYLEGRGAYDRGGEFVTIAALAKGLHYYVLPIVATYSMRMQSNLFKEKVKACVVD